MSRVVDFSPTVDISEYAGRVDSFGSESLESGHMSLFTVIFFVSGVLESSDLGEMALSPTQTWI